MRPWLGISVAVCVVGSLATLGWFVHHLLRFHPVPQMRVDVVPGVVGVHAGDAYAYIVRGHDGAVLIDAGSDPQARELIAALGEWGLGPDDVRAIMLTHAHVDHWAGSYRFQNAVAYVSAVDFELLRASRSHGGGQIAKLMHRMRRRTKVPRNVRPVLPGERLRIGELVFDVVSTPGHTRGSVMYLHQDVLFSGDGLWLEGSTVRVAPAHFSENHGDSLRSISRLEPLSFSVIADGHRGVASDGRARLEMWLNSHGPATH